MSGTEKDDANPVTRRGFISVTIGSAAIPITGIDSAHAAPFSSAETSGGAPVTLQVNAVAYTRHLDVRTTLLDALREHIGLTGTKKGCDHGQCGACTVHIDGRRILSCLTLALSAQGRTITTIEGISGTGAKLHPMQQAFIDHDAFQCGYCTPGQIMSALGCITEGKADSDDDIREAMSGNLCRCAAYPNIVAAIRQARSAMES